MSPRVLRFAAWAIAVASVGAGVVLARLDLPHARALAAAWTLVHLSAIVWLLSRNADGAIVLPRLVSEFVVLGAAPALLYGAAGAWGAAALLAVAMAAMNHLHRSRPHLRAEVVMGNPWRLAPSLWHPALWLIALSGPGSRGAWLGVGLVPLAQAASVLTRSPSTAVRAAGWAAWVACAIGTVAALS